MSKKRTAKKEQKAGPAPYQIEESHMVVRRAASKDPTRYSLEGIEVTEDGRATGTNGHYLLTVGRGFPKAAAAKTRILPGRFLKRVASMLKPSARARRRGDQPNAIVGDEAVDIENAAAEEGVTLSWKRPKDPIAEYPTWRQLLAEHGPYRAVSFHPKYVKEIMEACLEFGTAQGRRAAGITFHVPPPREAGADGKTRQCDPTFITCRGDVVGEDVLVGLLMPMRMSGEDTDVELEFEESEES